jgi:hypothetical protein
VTESASKTGVGARWAGASSDTRRSPATADGSVRRPTFSTQTRSTGTNGANTST